jgi:glutamate N-acetyltransferase/amino-acid N-acetyltransferase
VAAGLKASGRPDLALAAACSGTTAAAVFTKNRVVAAPLEVDRTALRTARGRVRVVLVNSGNANCATGPAGIKACQDVCKCAADLMGLKRQEIFPSSTGIIGVPLTAERIIAKLPELIAAADATKDGITRFAQAIMTTDLRMKTASVRFRAGASDVTLTGIAKGSGMIHPQLATMLVYLFTDISAAASDLQRLLRKTCDDTFNCISVDGDTSTNDTVLLMASGQSGVPLKKVQNKFSQALLAVCQSLAEQIVGDGEGVKHVIRLSIEQAKSREEGLRIAKAIAHSLLVKTAWAGADPNWGRILAAMGACGVPIRPDHVEISIGDQIVFRKGAANPFDAPRAHQHLSQPVCDIGIKLRRGRSSILFHTTDLTAEYVRINADYST